MTANKQSASSDIKQQISKSNLAQQANIEISCEFTVAEANNLSLPVTITTNH